MDIRSTMGAICLSLAVLGASPDARAASQATVPTANPDHLDFGTHDLGTTTTPVTVTIDNPTSSAVQFMPRSTRPDYAVVAKDCRQPVPSGGSCTVAVSFSPLGDGKRDAELRVGYPAAADKATAISVALTGTGALPELGVSPLRLWFPRQGLSGLDALQRIVLSNNSARDLTIRGVIVTGDFTVTAPGLPQKLEPHAIMVLPVRPKPGGRAVAGVVTILSDASVNPQSVSVAAASRGPLGEVLADPAYADFLFASALCLAYWLAMVAVRWHRVAMDTRGDLRGEINAVRAELDVAAASAGAATAATATAVAGLLREAGDLLDGPKDKSGNKVLNILFWSRGQEIIGWGYVHEAEVQMVPLLDDATVRARLEIAEPKLRLAGDPCSTALADTIHTALTSSPPETSPRLKALLTQALNINYHAEDIGFSDLVSWQNKASWLVLCGLSAILALTAVFPDHAVLLLVGAAGGLISRLSRSLNRKNVPTDYGASWSTLFLSPVAGAVGAWAGILIADLAVNAKVLGSIFQADWAHPTGIGTLSIALLFGFSERLLDSVLDKLEGQAAGDGTKSALAVVDAKLLDGTVGKPYQAQLQATGATGDVKWSVAQGSSLPDGLTLNPGGSITGTPGKVGTFTFTVEAVDQKGKSTRALTLKIGS